MELRTGAIKDCVPDPPARLLERIMYVHRCEEVRISKQDFEALRMREGGLHFQGPGVHVHMFR